MSTCRSCFLMKIESRQSKQKIVHIFGSLDRGGAETLVINLFNSLYDYFHFDFIVHGKTIGKYENQVSTLGSKIHRLPRFKVYNYFYYKYRVTKLLKEIDRETIVHIHIRSSSSILVKIAEKMKFAVVVHSHSTSNGNGIVGLIKNIFQYKSSSRVCNVACSISAGDWMFGKNKYIVLDNSIPFQKYEFSQINRIAVRSQFGIQNKIVLGHVGNYLPVKNHSFILDVLEGLKKKGRSDIVVMLIGSGLRNSELEKEIKTRNLIDQTVLVGETSEVFKFYSAFDVFIIPSLYEGFPMVTIEAQVNGLNIVASSNITSEIDLFGNVEFLELDVNQWVKSFSMTKSHSENHSRSSKGKNYNQSKHNSDNALKDLQLIYNKALQLSNK